MKTKNYCIIRHDLQEKRLKIPYDGGYIEGYCEMPYKYDGETFLVDIPGIGYREAESIDFEFHQATE